MTDRVVFNGSYADFKPVKTRSVWQVVIEIPAERAAEFVKLFGVPLPGQEQPVAVALIRPQAKEAEPDKPKKHWNEMLYSQRAGIRCGDTKFKLWLSTRYPNATCDAAELVRKICGVNSRADLNENHEAAEKFDKLDTQYLMDTGQLAEARA